MGEVELVFRLSSTVLDDPAGIEAALRPLGNLLAAPDAAGARLSLGGSQGRARRGLRVFPRLGLALGTAPADNLPLLRQDRRFREVIVADGGGPSLVRPVARARESGPILNGWGALRLGVPELWSRGITGRGIRIGHLDTGVEGRHQALRGQIEAFASFNPEGFPLPGAPATDSDPEGHGTHTAGIMVGQLVSKGRFGVAPGARLISAEVIEGGDVVARVLAGLEWMLEQRVQVVNLSLGLRGFRGAFLASIEALVEADVLCVAAVGNEGAGTSRSPGNYPNVLSVGAVDRHDAIAEWSGSARIDHGDPAYIVPHLVAPGVDIISCVRDGAYDSKGGTSMAAPRVAGLAALLREAAPGASAADVRQAILASAARAPGMDPLRAGTGIPNGPRAIEILRVRGLVAPGV